MFFKINETQAINLDNVAYINFTNNGRRAIIVFDYPVKIKKISPKLVGDYHYFDEPERFDELRFICGQSKFKSVKTETQEYFINPKNVSSVKISETYVVVNFNSPVNFTDKSGDTSQLTAQFVYIDAAGDDRTAIFDYLISKGI